MDFIIGIAQLLLFLAPFLIGRSLNNSFEEKYGVEAIRQEAFIWQCIFLFLTGMTMFDNTISWWQILWILCTIVTYAKALMEVREHAIKIGASSDDTIKAMVSQAVYPLGLIMIIFIVLAFIFGGKKKKRRRRKIL